MGFVGLTAGVPDGDKGTTPETGSTIIISNSKKAQAANPRERDIFIVRNGCDK
jgi:hypothetical protein